MKFNLCDSNLLSGWVAYVRADYRDSATNESHDQYKSDSKTRIWSLQRAQCTGKESIAGKLENESWYLLTNLPDLKTAVHIYNQRFGIEAMFRDCKTGGYNLEASKASPDRLMRLLTLIAIALTAAWLQGQRTLLQRQQAYVCRSQEKCRTRKRHSSFWNCLYGQNWIVAFHEGQVWVEELMDSIRNKQTFYRQGLRAMVFIQQPL